MKALNCANCGANLNYNIGAPVSICQFCDSVNVLDCIQIPIIQSHINLSGSTPPSYIEELKPRIMLPEEKFRAACYNRGTQGGHLWVANTEIFFKPNLINFDYTKTYMKIADIVEFVPSTFFFGLQKFLTIIDKNGNEIELQVYSLNSIISEIEKRKTNLV